MEEGAFNSVDVSFRIFEILYRFLKEVEVLRIILFLLQLL